MKINSNSREVKFWSAIEAFYRTDLDDRNTILERYLDNIAPYMTTQEKIEFCSFVYEKINDLKRVVDNYVITTGRHLHILKIKERLLASFLSNLVAMGSQVYSMYYDAPDLIVNMFNSDFKEDDELENDVYYTVNSFVSAIDIIGNLSDEYIRQLCNEEITYEIEKDECPISYTHDCDECPKREQCKTFNDVCDENVNEGDLQVVIDMSREPIVRFTHTKIVTNDGVEVPILRADFLTRIVNDDVLEILNSRIDGIRRNLFREVRFMYASTDAVNGGYSMFYELAEPYINYKTIRIGTVHDHASIPYMFRDRTDIKDLTYPEYLHKKVFSFHCGNVLSSFQYDDDLLYIFDIMLGDDFDACGELRDSHDNVIGAYVLNKNNASIETDEGDVYVDLEGKMRHCRRLRFYENHRSSRFTKNGYHIIYD